MRSFRKYGVNDVVAEVILAYIFGLERDYGIKGCVVNNKLDCALQGLVDREVIERGVSCLVIDIGTSIGGKESELDFKVGRCHRVGVT